MLEQLATVAKELGIMPILYRDLAQPGVQQVGKAIGTILGLGNTMLWRIEYLNEKSKLLVQHNLEIYREKVAKIPMEAISAVPAEVGVPILESLGYITDVTLRDCFIELLAKASTENNQPLAHPSFPWILRSLSPDEARILNCMRTEPELPCIDPKYVAAGRATVMMANFSLYSEAELALSYPTNIHAYVANLCGQGLTQKIAFELAPRLSRYLEMENTFRSEVGEYRPDGHPLIEFDRGSITLTDLGKLFVKAIGAIEARL